jgi:hypothetical protein
VFPLLILVNPAAALPVVGDVKQAGERAPSVDAGPPLCDRPCIACVRAQKRLHGHLTGFWHRYISEGSPIRIFPERVAQTIQREVLRCE